MNLIGSGEASVAEPGWYNAAGDPPGTQRYWDGNQWLGDAVYEPATPPPIPPPPIPPGVYAYAGAPVATSTFPSGLKAIAIILSILKVIPLGFAVFGLILVAALANDFDDEFGDIGFGLDGLLGAAIAVLLVIVLVGALLLGFQFVGALKERPMMVFIPALLMSLVDGLFTLGAWASWNDARKFTVPERGRVRGSHLGDGSDGSAGVRGRASDTSEQQVTRQRSEGRLAAWSRLVRTGNGRERPPQ